MEALQVDFDVEIFLNYLTDRISNDESRILLCYDEISVRFKVNDDIIDLALNLLIDSNIVSRQYRPYKREFFLY